MERVVYILGAGFSAPLGLPVMSNFILKAKDMYFQDSEKYAYFKEVFDLLDKMSVIKNYFSANLYNIEEVLSILEMNDYLNSGNNGSDKFKNLITDVIKFYTPEVIGYGNPLPGNWDDFIFGTKPLERYYGTFIASLLGVKVQLNNERKLFWSISEDNQTVYSIVSFNYDRVLESYIDFMKKIGVTTEEVFFNTEWESKIPQQTLLHKLHGSVEKQNIVPPTWNKYSNPELHSTWQDAWLSIKNANHIRIIGYSLPVSDSYIKYFLKSSILGAQHLKSIDVLTLDNYNNDVKNQYDDFIDFNYYRFKNVNVVDYLNNLHSLQFKRKSYNSPDVITFNQLETAHNQFMSVN